MPICQILSRITFAKEFNRNIWYMLHWHILYFKFSRQCVVVLVYSILKMHNNIWYAKCILLNRQTHWQTFWDKVLIGKWISFVYRILLININVSNVFEFFAKCVPHVMQFCFHVSQFVLRNDVKNEMISWINIWKFFMQFKIANVFLVLHVAF